MNEYFLFREVKCCDADKQICVGKHVCGFLLNGHKDGQMDNLESAGYGNLTSGQTVKASKTKKQNINIYTTENTFKGALKSVYAKAPGSGINDLNLTDTEKVKGA
jgi:hypothetical protein